MKKYEELTMYDKIDFFTEVLGYDRKRVMISLSHTRSLFNNPDVRTKLNCKKYPTEKEIQDMVFDTLIRGNIFNCSSLKEVYEWVYELNLKIKKYDEKIASTFDDFFNSVAWN